MKHFSPSTSEREYCPDCKKFVIPDGKLDATGITNICPNCGSDTKSDKQLRKEAHNEH